mgnify:CR=1 FL=1
MRLWNPVKELKVVLRVVLLHELKDVESGEGIERFGGLV